MYSKLREIRKQHGYTCGYMADILKITKAYYSQIETGARNLSYNRAVLIAQVFNLKPDEIFYEDHLKNRLKK